MTNAITPIGCVSSDISTKLANMAIEFGAVAQRLAETSRCLRKATARERRLALDGIAEALRDIGKGAHDHARTVEAELGRPKP